MDFKRKYKGSDLQTIADDGLRIRRYPVPCRVCGTSTRFTRLDVKASVCSEECDHALNLLLRTSNIKRTQLPVSKWNMTRITPERCTVKYLDGSDHLGWAVATEFLERFYVVFDDGTEDLVPLDRTFFISKEPHIDINRYR